MRKKIETDEPVRWLVRFWQDQAAVMLYRELRELVIGETDPESLFDIWFQDYSKMLSEKMTPVWEQAFLEGWKNNSLFCGEEDVISSESWVRSWIVDHTGDLITNCCNEQVSAIRYLIAEAESLNMSSAETARYIRPTIGLTERQAAANLKYYNSIKERLTTDHPRMKPESIERKAREAASKYAERQQRYRAETIARSEIAQAYNHGVSGNVPANTITIMASPINGVTAITNSEKTSGGAEEENDEDYYERIHAEFQDSQFYVANDADYIKWAKEVPGIGDCIVEPAVEGPGTVGLILVDSNGQPASSTLVTAVYNHIVSPNDRSKRLLPTGSSKLIVKSATVKTVDFACTGLVLDGVGLDDVISTFKTEMMAVYSAAKETNILRYNSARTVLSTITGVSDFIDFTMDGKRENIHLSSSEYADTGNVTFTLEGAET